MEGENRLAWERGYISTVSSICTNYMYVEFHEMLFTIKLRPLKYCKTQEHIVYFYFIFFLLYWPCRVLTIMIPYHRLNTQQWKGSCCGTIVQGYIMISTHFSFSFSCYFIFPQYLRTVLTGWTVRLIIPPFLFFLFAAM